MRSGALIVSVLIVVYLAPRWLQAVALGLVLVGSHHEVVRLVGVRRWPALGAGSIFSGLLLVAVSFWSPLMAVSLWLAALLISVAYALSGTGSPGPAATRAVGPALAFALGTFATGLLSASWYARVPEGLSVFALVVWSTWAGDFGSGVSRVITERLPLGRHAMWAWASPHKTWEGTVVGSIYLSLLATAFRWLFRVPIDGEQFLVVLVIICIARPAGDLVESAAKRLAGAKDSGSFAALPERGGVLDMVDSLTFTVPIVFTGWQLVRH